MGKIIMSLYAEKNSAIKRENDHFKRRQSSEALAQHLIRDESRTPRTRGPQREAFTDHAKRAFHQQTCR